MIASIGWYRHSTSLRLLRTVVVVFLKTVPSQTGAHLSCARSGGARQAHEAARLNGEETEITIKNPSGTTCVSRHHRHRSNNDDSSCFIVCAVWSECAQSLHEKRFGIRSHLNGQIRLERRSPSLANDFLQISQKKA